MTAAHEFNPGDLIRVKEGDASGFDGLPFFTAGNLARLEYEDEDGHWWADFDGQGNPEGEFMRIGTEKAALWCVGPPEKFDLVEAAS